MTVDHKCSFLSIGASRTRRSLSDGEDNRDDGLVTTEDATLLQSPLLVPRLV